MSLIKQIDKTICLLLDKRMDYWGELLEQCRKVGLNPDPFLVGSGNNLNYDLEDIDELPPVYPASTTYPSWLNKPQAFNAWRGHHAIFRKCQLEGVNNLLLLEDDAIIEPDFLEIVEKTENFWKHNHWDVIYFGSFQHHHSWNKTDNEYIVRTNGCGGFRGVLLSKKIIDELLSFLPLSPYDELCHRYLHSIYKCYAFRPSIISQRNNVFSYVEGSNLEKPSRYF